MISCRERPGRRSNSSVIEAGPAERNLLIGVGSVMARLCIGAVRPSGRPFGRPQDEGRWFCIRKEDFFPVSKHKNSLHPEEQRAAMRLEGPPRRLRALNLPVIKSRLP
jgi:hypothetical protein